MSMCFSSSSTAASIKLDFRVGLVEVSPGICCRLYRRPRASAGASSPGCDAAASRAMAASPARSICGTRRSSAAISSWSSRNRSAVVSATHSLRVLCDGARRSTPRRTLRSASSCSRLERLSSSRNRLRLACRAYSREGGVGSRERSRRPVVMRTVVTQDALQEDALVRAVGRGGAGLRKAEREPRVP